MSKATEFTEDVLLLKYLEHKPELSELVKEAERKVEEENPSPLKKKIFFWKFLRQLFIADAKEFNGKAIVSQELQEHAAITARTVTVSNLIDLSSNFPVIFEAFRFLNPIGALIISFVITVGIVKFGNDTAAAVASRKYSNKKWSKAAIIGLLSLNLVQTITSGIGVELLNNQSALSLLKANEVINEQKSKHQHSRKQWKEVIEESPPYQQYLKAEQQCNENIVKLEKMNAQDPHYHRVFLETYGTYEQKKNPQWERITTEKLPHCPKMNRLESENKLLFENYHLVEKKWEEKLMKQTDNDLIFLKNEFPESYDLYFLENGTIKDGGDRVRLASQNFLNKLITGNLSALGFSLFFFSISAITSLTSCLMTLAHSQREETINSRDESIIKSRNDWLYEQWILMLERHREEENKLEGKEESL
jgi:hypothetical protein